MTSSKRCVLVDRCDLDEGGGGQWWEKKDLDFITLYKVCVFVSNYAVLVFDGTKLRLLLLLSWLFVVASFWKTL